MRFSKRQVGIVIGVLMSALSSISIWAAESAVPLQRARICLNGEWDFYGKAKEDAPPAAGWEKIRVPGDWFYTNCGQWSPGTVLVRKEWVTGMSAWYRLEFMAPAGWNDGRFIRLDFEGVNHYAKVMLNGQYLGEHYGCLTAFGFDVTKTIKFGQTNSLLVFVQSGILSIRKQGISDGGTVAGRRAERTAGIHRDVYLTCRPPVSVENTFVQTSFRKKEIKVKFWVRNDDAKPRTVDVAALVQKEGKAVLSLGKRALTVPAGATATVELKKRWRDPELWGFGQWGAPVLYFLKTDLSEASTPLDTDYTRFGFREFWCEKGQFWLNGKKIFIVGDTPNFSGATDNRQFLTVFSRAEREANISLLRSHTYILPDTSYDVTDELGMLMQPEFSTTGNSLSNIPAYIVYEKTVIRDVISKLWNHPSIVMWSDDNEGSSGKADPGHTLVHKDLYDTIRQLDPTRPIDSNGNCSLFSVKKQYKIDFKPDVFNVHPYGNPAYPEVKRQMKQFNWDGEAPVYVGELFADVSVIHQSASTLLKNQTAAYLGYRAMGRFFLESIITFHKNGLAGCAPHTMDGTGYWGPVTPTIFALGPGKCVITNWPEKVLWPSLSGPGAKVENPGGTKLWNWFDPEEPAYTPNIVHKLVAFAYRLATGADVGALNPRRAPEVIVTVTRAGEPVQGVYVVLTGLEKQAMNPEGVMTDKDGTAWFVLKEPGAYEAVCATKQSIGKTMVKAEWGRTNDRPGYEHIRHVLIRL
ncbi:MAG: glycoside hydrolase family 2 TIM barrel-domain containing protein [Kiritimatiellae bacterium]|nr:glycoside hydrolase family 2 TIM barrel-domain containing protein [Kiritimatiellia bacterium]